MRKLAIATVWVAISSPALAQSAPSLPTMAPVLGDVGLVALAVALGLGGAWGIRKYRGK
jgi:hypothetical protein